MTKNLTITALENVLKILDYHKDNTPAERERLFFAARGYIVDLLDKVADLRDSDDGDIALAIVVGKYPEMANYKDWEDHARLREAISGDYLRRRWMEMMGEEDKADAS